MTTGITYADNEDGSQTAFEQVGQTRAYLDGPYGPVGGAGAPIRINFRPKQPQVDRTNMQNGTKLGTKPITNPQEYKEKEKDKEKEKEFVMCGRCLP